MRQRVMIALALSCNPSVLIADEPTTALDVTIQAQILERIRELRAETNAAVILVTHDLGVVADIADRIAVMYAGRIVEHGTLDQIFYDPQHPYTWGLLGSITRVDRIRQDRLPAIAGVPPSLLDPPEGCHFRPRCPHEFAECVKVPPLASHLPDSPEPRGPLLAERRGEARPARGAPRRDRARRRRAACPREPARDGHLPARRTATRTARPRSSRWTTSSSSSRSRTGILFEREVARVHAVNDVTFSIMEGETLGLVGESGCGKTTMSRAIMRLIDSTDGTIKFRGQDVTHAGRREMEPLRRQMQMVFQDPFASLNPRRRVGQIIGAPLRLHGTARGDVEPKVKELLERVGLHPEHLHRYPARVLGRPAPADRAWPGRWPSSRA